MSNEKTDVHTDLRSRVEALLAEHDPATTDQLAFLQARFDAGLAWVWFPEGLGGLGLPRELQLEVNAQLDAAGAPQHERYRNQVGLDTAAPTILAFGTEEQKRRLLKPLWTGEEIWCQLFSEPGAGSDLAGLSTRAVREGDEWVVNGQKVWTSLAHKARWGILLARTDPDVPKHAGITFFVCDMTDPGVDVRPLRQITGEAEFYEVFLTDVRVPDDARLGAEGEGWKVANTTLNNEREAIGGSAPLREAGVTGVVFGTWRERPDRHTPELHDRLLALWVEAEAARLAGQRLRQKLAAGQPGREGAATKLAFAKVAQATTGLEVELLGEEGLRYSGWTVTWPDHADPSGRDAAYRYLRTKASSLAGGTSEILRNIVAERVLGLPPEPRVDKNLPWKDLPR
jgi:alkylation response protein AidB-like acyl-CoA dehydrogenase